MGKRRDRITLGLLIDRECPTHVVSSSLRFLRTYLRFGGRRHSDAQAPRSQRRDQFAGRVATQDQSTRRGVLFHGPTQRGLGLSRQPVHLVQDHHLDFRLLGSGGGGGSRSGGAFGGTTASAEHSPSPLHVGQGTGNILGGGDVFEDVLDDEPIVVAGVARTELHVMFRRDHVDLDRPSRGRGEGPLRQFEPVGRRTEQGPQEGGDAGPFAAPRRSVEEQVGQTGRVLGQALQATTDVVVEVQIVEILGTVLVYPQHGDERER